MRYIFALVFSVLLASSAYCEDAAPDKSIHHSFWAGLGMMSGHTTYQIGGDYEMPDSSGTYRWPISELEFPLDVIYGSLGTKLDLADRLEIAAEIKKNISDGSGQMKDKDWGYNYERYNGWPDPNSLDISSVADTQLDALMAEISTRIYANPWRYQKTDFIFYAGGKYAYHKFDFSASNVDQWYPSHNDHYGFDRGHVRISGEVLTYEVTKSIPAVLAGMKIVTDPSLTLDISLGYSPYVTVKDEDHHLEKSLVSKSECDGDAVLFSLSGEILLFTGWSLGMKYDYTAIDTRGTETQYHDWGNATIEQKNFSDVHMYELTVTYRF